MIEVHALARLISSERMFGDVGFKMSEYMQLFRQPQHRIMPQRNPTAEPLPVTVNPDPASFARSPKPLIVPGIRTLVVTLTVRIESLRTLNTPSFSSKA